MKKYLFLLIAILSVFLFLNTALPQKADDNFKQEWSKVEKYTNSGLPKSALKIVDIIYLKAKQQQNETQIIKTLIYKISLKSTFEEDYRVKSITSLEVELQTADEPEKSLLYSLLGQLYQGYFDNNKYKILPRTQTLNFNESDIRTWDAMKFQRKIQNYYFASVSQKEITANIPLERFKAILSSDDKKMTFNLRPTLYDLLAQRAINWFSSSDASQFSFTRLQFDSIQLAPAVRFASILLPEKQGVVMQVLSLYQQLLRLHLNDRNVSALIDIDLKRLAFVKNHLPKNKIYNLAYRRTLEELLKQHHNNSISVRIAYVLASNYLKTANEYSLNINKKDRFDLNTAENICKKAISNFPKSQFANGCRNILQKINSISFDFKIQEVSMPNRAFLARITFKNTKKLYFKVVESDFDLNSHNYQARKQKMQKLSQKNGKLTFIQLLPRTYDHRQHSAEIMFKGLRAGHYVIFASDNRFFSDTATLIYHDIQISNLSYLVKNNANGGSINLYVRNRNSGKAVADALVEVYIQKYNNRWRKYASKLSATYHTDNNGFLNIPYAKFQPGTYLLFDISKAGNRCYYSNTYDFYRNNEPKEITSTYFFTDRAIYRPGQIVYFKGIRVKQLADNAEVVKNKNVKVRLLDANYKNVGELNLRTNDFGSFEGSFVLPTGKLNGRFTLRDEKGSVSFKVEEYKRPDFKVTIDTLKGKYLLNNLVVIYGKANDYTGSALTGAKVSYRVTRKQFFITPYYRYFPMPGYQKEIEISSGNIVTGNDGSFSFGFKAIGNNLSGSNYYRFTVYVDVTDITGEVQSAQSVVTIGKTPFVISINSPSIIDREQSSGFHITAKNLSGKTVTIKAVLSLWRLTPPQRILNHRLWPKSDTILIPKSEFINNFPHEVYGNDDNKNKWPRFKILSKNISIEGNDYFSKNELRKLKPGEYVVRVKSISAKGDTVSQEQFVSLFSEKSKTIPVHSPLWYAFSKTKAEPGQNIKVFLGSAAKNTYVLFEVFNGDKPVTNRWIKLNRKLQTIKIPVLENYRGNFTVFLTAIRYNRSYTVSQTIVVPFTNKKLNITLETKRNYLTPGKKEKWLVNITGANGTKVTAELLAGMYDASLDQFATNRWTLQLFHHKKQLRDWKSGTFSLIGSSLLFSPKQRYYPAPSVNYPSINWFNYRFSSRNYLYGVMTVADNEEILPLKEKSVPAPKKETDKATLEMPEKTILPTEQQKPKAIETVYRTNFNETAFFYPQLRTDSLGNVSFVFTTPDALTEWKLMLLAHTRDLKTGTLIRNIKAQKKLMIIPNKPRFVRADDVLDFTAKVINFTDKNFDVRVNIEFFDPANLLKQRIVENAQTQSQHLTLEAGKSKAVSWKIHIPQGIDLLAYRIKAISESFTDGVEDLLPVLPDKMLVTETLPMNIKGHSTKTFKFTKLINAGKNIQAEAVDNYRYTVEFTSHPVWYGVQALPYLAKPRYESAQNIFNRYYANRIASGIVTKYPQIKSVLESWKLASPDAFLSNLKKNQELKNVLLDATPWVLEAETESEQKRRIALLFDINNLSNSLDKSLQKIKQLQLPSGAWPWFKGMRDDRFATLSIVKGFARLREMSFYSSNNNNTRKILKKAVYYLDKKINEDYAKLKKQNVSLKKKHIGSLQTLYLYARTAFLDAFPLKDSDKKAFDYYVSQAKRYWLTQNDYLQASTAIVMNRLNYRNEAEAIIRSLSERAIENNELGMYWRIKSGWNWYQAPVETEVMIMDAYDEVMHDKKSLEKMKIWLLKNKQTRHWKTPSATVDAVYGLLMKGSDWLAETKAVDVQVGKISLAANTKVQAGTGYLLKSWMHSEITPAMGTIIVKNPNSSIAWGAAYYQYFEKLDKIREHQSPLQIQKNIFVEKLTAQGPVMTEYSKGKHLKTGDKVIVRLVIRSDRSIDYVHLKDMRCTAFEPINTLSGTQFKDGLVYYQNIKDASVDFFIRHLSKGTFVLEYPLRISQRGSFSNGIATLQSLYAPEFAAHSSGMHIVVKE